ncbi:tudor domain-containing protein 15 isoform X6 [Artibeus jamaicensis]|uniref:tudor domain-containing protein 15 isoform X6 n=1 Tax=Artibeus jamaicensis TaxID=9417 RepID=UPI00235A5442|nr:tudor domain-containing protein 15 isoform X6 [Artibeus jamaicensis]
MRNKAPTLESNSDAPQATQKALQNCIQHWNYTEPKMRTLRKCDFLGQSCRTNMWQNHTFLNPSFFILPKTNSRSQHCLVSLTGVHVGREQM